MTAPPIRVQLRRTKGWRMPPDTVSVARPSRWGNPYVVVLDKMVPTGDRDNDGNEVLQGPWMCTYPGSRLRFWFPTKEAAQQRAVELFRIKLMSGDPDMVALRERALDVLRWKNLACFCAEGSPCHADVWLAVANRRIKP